MDARVANSLQDSRSPAVQPGTQLHWTWPAAFDACGVARLAALSLSLARGPKAHGLKLTSARSIYPREGKKGAKEKARFYWTSALLHRQLHIAPPIKLSLLASVTRAFFFSFSLFFTIDAIIPRLSLYKLESRWVYKTLSVLVFFSFLFFETMENGEDSKIRGFGNQRFEDSCPPFSPYYSSRRRVVVSFRNHR